MLISPLFFWAVVFLALIHEFIRGLRRLLPKSIEQSNWFRKILVFLPLVLGAILYRLFPGAAPEIAGPLLYLWGALVGSLSAAGYELNRLLRTALLSHAKTVLVQKEGG